ncbi:condensation domain-containing protein [Nocardia wallacei]|uniref:Putative conserved polyketide synthase associated protein PapA2 n=1 Tax=Nocardia wallacei TaxID=480035 RepID=A0A7G1KPI5_9NOCA|nr:condensation domain-containing protein [Nocardia wallacei]BCK56761.1 putative conserved polyketide synthase associated protein PapA2 [Nocardia wallacei]
MVNFGFFDDWHPEPGRLTSWTASPRSRATVRQAPVHEARPSYQQEAYLQAAHRNSGADFRVSRLCMIAFDIPGAPVRAAMTRTVNAFLRRHDTFSSWFALDSDGRFVRHVAAAEDIEFEATEHGEFTDSAAIRAHVQAETPGPEAWDCFSFGVIERDHSFTVYAAVDHLHTDGVAQALSCVDLLTLYGRELSGGQVPIAEVDGHIAHCARERERNGRLTLESPQVRRWVELLQRNDGDVPSFPLELGGSGGYTTGAVVTVPLMSEAEALRFEQACVDHGGRFHGGLFVALAIAQLELTGKDWYFGFSPANTRSTPGEAGSIGWYTNLIPITLAIRPDDTFTTLVGPAQESAERAKDLLDVSLHRVLELVTPDLGIRTRPGWAAPMLSYVDVRKIAGAEMFDQINGGLFGNNASAGEVYTWVNRFHDQTKLSVLFPDTPQAHESIDRYVKAVTSVITAVAAEGDYGIRADTWS